MMHCLLAGILLCSVPVMAEVLNFPPIEGEVSVRELLDQIEPYRSACQKVVLDTGTLQTISGSHERTEVFVFFGTWCSDSLHHVPHFIQMMEYLHFPPEQTHYIGVNREKVDPEKLAHQNAVARLPTMIIFFEGREVGRIDENPVLSLEKDFAKILSFCHSSPK